MTMKLQMPIGFSTFEKYKIGLQKLGRVFFILLRKTLSKLEKALLFNFRHIFPLSYAKKKRISIATILGTDSLLECRKWYVCRMAAKVLAINLT